MTTPDKEESEPKKKINPIFMIDLSDEEKSCTPKKIQSQDSVLETCQSINKPNVQRVRKTFKSILGSQSTDIEKFYEDSVNASISIIKCKESVKIKNDSISRSSPTNNDIRVEEINNRKSDDNLIEKNKLKKDDIFATEEGDSVIQKSPLKPLDTNLKVDLTISKNMVKNITTSDRTEMIFKSLSPSKATKLTKNVPSLTKPSSPNSDSKLESRNSDKTRFKVKFEPGLSDYLRELTQSDHFQTSNNEVKCFHFYINLVDFKLGTFF